MKVDMHAFLAATTNQAFRYLDRVLPRTGESWWQTCVMAALTPQQAEHVTRASIQRLDELDLAALLRVLEHNWHLAIDPPNRTQANRTYLKEMMLVRNRWAHTASVPDNPDDTLRDLDTMQRFCRMVGAEGELIELMSVAKRTLISQMHNPNNAEMGRLPSRDGIRGSARRMRSEQDFLHNAMVNVLEEAGNSGLTPNEICHRIVSRNLYRQLDGSELTLQQVYARLRNYRDLFDLDTSVRPMIVRVARQ